ncbi:MAG: hypothetical protein Q9174_000481 [Haloplaca sp. 1 TL-2023]
MIAPLWLFNNSAIQIDVIGNGPDPSTANFLSIRPLVTDASAFHSMRIPGATSSKTVNDPLLRFSAPIPSPPSVLPIGTHHPSIAVVEGL